ncbi:MAG: NirD/YgiW/YdeI family stress tolerance protein [Paracoccaceae bacterium]|jgi:uncharacterized protein YdeI (BOF family)|nr:NirD/YgiW/YdeI family stress tolerance protein [Paracoccaceae bacterium]
MKRLVTAGLFAALATSAAWANPITTIADAKRGTTVTVQGTVERITDEDEFRLADASGQIRIYVGPNWVPADVGEKVTVNGFVDDDPGPREIYARSLTRAGGSVITFSYNYD